MAKNRRSSPNLKPNQKLALRKYMDPESDTFANGVRSFMQAYPNQSPASAAVGMSNLLKSANTREYLEQLASKYGIDDEVRASLLAEIAKGNTVTRTITKHPNGSETIVEREPTMNERIKAIEIWNKLLGRYDQIEVDKHAAIKQIDELWRKHERRPS